MFQYYKAAWGLLQPPNLLVFAVVIGALLAWTRWWRWGRRLVTLGGMGLMLIGPVPLVPWIGVQLENRFPVADPLPNKVTGIILLGGSINLSLTGARNVITTNPSVERLTEFMRLARLYPDARLVFTGGTQLAGFPEVKEDIVARRFFTEAGFDTSRILFEGHSRTTWENASECTKLLGNGQNEVWLLVTSAMHMPRAVASFRAFGWNVIPYPTSFRTKGTAVTPNWNFAYSLSLFQNVSDEVVGLASYYVLGRTGVMFPAPVL